MDKQPTTLRDIAKALGTSIGSVHRALHDSPGVSRLTKDRVLQMARNLGYRPNLAARYLSSKKTLRISVNTLQGTTSFWDEVRTGIREAAASILLENVEIKFRTYPRLGEGDEEALEAAVRDQVDGIITFPSRPQVLRSWIRRASRARIPVLHAARDANMLDRLTIITTDLFPDLVPMIRSGAVAATIYQRPRAQGQIAFRMLHEFLVEGANRSNQVALAPHLVMRGNLDFFLQRQSQELFKEKADGRQETTRDLAARWA
jgi:DNA-binding LacI/PurR family transcriptional regulator